MNADGGDRERGGREPRPASPPLDERAAVDEELAFHLEMLEREVRETEDVDEGEARRRARARFGDLPRIRREIRRAGGGTSGKVVRTLASGGLLDSKLVLRQLAHSPGFTLAAVVSLALGIGAAAAVLALLDGYFLRPLPYPDGDRLVALWETQPNSREPMTIAPGNLRDWKEASRTLESIAGYNIASATVTDPGDATILPAAVVEPHFFRLLGVAPLLGSGLDPEGPSDQVVLSHGFWQRRFGGAPDVIGRTVRVGGTPRTVVGVMGPDFRHPERDVGWARPELWAVLDYQGLEGSREFRFLRAVGRMAPGAGVQEARGELEGLARRLAEAHPEHNAGRSVLVTGLAQEYLGGARKGILVLAAAGGLVLLLVSANLTTLVLSRTEQRTREFALRSALGSGGGRLVRHVLLEALLLTAAGALLGSALLFAGGEALEGLQAARFSPLADVRFDWRVVPMVGALALVTALASALAPALRVRSPDLRGALVGGGGAGPRRVGRTRGLLVVSELALTVVLLVSAGLLLRSFVSLVSVPPGFDVEHLVIADLSASSDRYPDRDAVLAFYDEVLERARSLPRLGSASLVSDLPFLDENRWQRVWPEGPRPAPGEEPRSEFHVVAPDYFETMGIPLLSGRAFGQDDDAHSAPVAVVNRALVALLWPSTDPIGRRMTMESGDSTLSLTVVGLVEDVRDDGYDAPPERLFYLPLPQYTQRSLTLVARVEPGAEASIAPALRTLVRDVDPLVPVELGTMAELAATRTAAPRDALLLVGAFALLAVVLAAVGVYGVMAQMVTARTREIGIRTALGADRGRVMREVLGRSGRLVIGGAVVGLGGAVLTSGLLHDLLFEVEPLDPLSYGGAVLLLSLVGLGASWAPARRATRVDPLVAIRSE